MLRIIRQITGDAHFVVALLAALALTSCGVNQGLVRETMAEVRITGPGFRLVKTDVRAALTVTSILCIIPLDTRIYTKLMAAVHKGAQLKENQTLINIREDFSVRSFLLWCESDYALSADVIEFGPSSVQ